MNRSTLPRTNGRVAAGTCEACGFVNATTGSDTMRCAGPACGARVRLVYVTGNLNARQPCDGRCQYAYGPACSCSCGGDNHRVGYINPGLVPVWVRDRDRERHAAKGAREAAKVAARQQRADDGREAILAAHPELADLLGDRYGPGIGASDFMLDMRAALLSGDMTDRQIKAACGAVTRDRAREDRRAKQDAARDAARARGVRVTAGRQTITGTVISIREKETQFSYHGSTSFQITVQDDDGRRFTGTLPRDLEPEWSGRWADAFVGWTCRAPGQRLTFTATVRDPKPGDLLHAYYTHPKLTGDSARLLADPAAQAAPQAADTPAAPAATIPPAPTPQRAPQPAPDPVSAPTTPTSWADLFATVNP